MKDYSKQRFVEVGKKREVGGGWNLVIKISLILFFIGFGLGVVGRKIHKEQKVEVTPGPITNFPNLESNPSVKVSIPKNADNLIRAITSMTNDKQGTYGWLVKSLDSEREYGVKLEDLFTAASINKLPIVAYYLKQTEIGELSLSDTYKLSDEDIEEGSGTLQYQKKGSYYSYDELLHFIGKYSDNTATNVLVAKLGKEKIQEFINDLGMENTKIEENKTTTKDMALLLSLIYRDEFFENKRTRDYFFDLFINTDFETRIPAGVPDGVLVSHKIWNQIQVWSDCGIIFGSHPYVLCVLTDGIKEEEAKIVLPEISRLVWEFEKD
jgi:beta-lactamase class A